MPANSGYDFGDFASPVLASGGTGAAIGTAILPGVGTAIGGAIGAGVGVLQGFFRGAEDTETIRRLEVHKRELEGRREGVSEFYSDLLAASRGEASLEFGAESFDLTRSLQTAQSRSGFESSGALATLGAQRRGLLLDRTLGGLETNRLAIGRQETLAQEDINDQIANLDITIAGL
jgi:hypothetical protein